MQWFMFFCRCLTLVDCTLNILRADEEFVKQAWAIPGDGGSGLPLPTECRAIKKYLSTP